MDLENSPIKSEFNLAKIISGLTICAFILGIIYPITFYSFFYFNVFDYIELNEIVTHVIGLAVFIMVPYFIVTLIGITLNNKEVPKMFLDTDKSIKRRKIFRYTFLLILLILIGYVIYEYYVNVFSLAFLFFYVLTLFCSNIMDMPKRIRNKLNTDFNIKISPLDYSFIYILFMVLYGALTFSFIKVDSVKYKHSTIGNYIIIKEDTIKSSLKYYYIGKTDKYVFYYDEKKKNVDVYPEKDIEKYSIH